MACKAVLDALHRDERRHEEGMTDTGRHNYRLESCSHEMLCMLYMAGSSEWYPKQSRQLCLITLAQTVLLELVEIQAHQQGTLSLRQHCRPVTQATLS